MSIEYIRRTPTTNQEYYNKQLEQAVNELVNRVNINYSKVTTSDIRRPFVNKSDIYALNFLNADKELIYQIGINDPFKAGAQHIGYEDYKEYQFDVPLKNFKVVVPQEVEASYIELVRRTHNNELIIMDI